jgi:hypothetical protein
MADEIAKRVEAVYNRQGGCNPMSDWYVAQTVDRFEITRASLRSLLCTANTGER